MCGKYDIPRGFRDFPPEVMSIRLEVIEKARKVFEKYGFPPMDTPSIEYWETLRGKYGEEAENKLIWRFKDPFSDKEYALRYDLTVPLARYISNHPELQLPFKRHQISYVWRHEEPQRGRYREFLQADIDTVGSPYVEADAEIINAIDAFFNQLEIKNYLIRLNHRKLLALIFEEKFAANSLQLLRTIDKLDKIGIEGVINELKKLGYSDNEVAWVASLIENRIPVSEADNAVKILRSVNEKTVPIFNDLIEISDLANHPDRLIFDMSLVRGLDYYTGPIFEVVLEDNFLGSLSGGGRYDNLIEKFGGRPLPATGGSIGIERVIDIIINSKGIDAYKAKKTVLVIVVDKDAYKYAWRLTNDLRENGVSAEIDLMRRPIEKQKKRAQRSDIRFLVYVGKVEMGNNTITVYDTETNERKVLSKAEGIKYLSNELP